MWLKNELMVSEIERSVSQNSVQREKWPDVVYTGWLWPYAKNMYYLGIATISKVSGCFVFGKLYTKQGLEILSRRVLVLVG